MTDLNAQHRLTNAEIEARKSAAQKAAERGTRTEVSMMRNLLRGYQLIWGTGSEANLAEIRDCGNNDTVVFRGTKAECIAEAKRRKLL